MTDRQKTIFKYIVELYIKEGEPVGSKRILEETDLGVSSATVRNEMSLLEKKGLLEKTHTSSGRIPSEEGYRYYIENLLSQDPEAVKPKELSQLLNDQLGESVKKMDQIIDVSSDILSHLTNYTAFILGPEAGRQRLAGFSVVELAEDQVMCILVTDRGNVENLIFHLPDHVSVSDLKEALKIIESEVVGLTLLEASKRLRGDLPDLLDKYISFSSERLIQKFVQIMEKSISSKVGAVSGQMNLLEFLEGRDTKQIKSFYQALEDQKLWQTLVKSQEDSIMVRIGDDLDDERFTDFSLLTASYHVSDLGNGMIAILGPQNMSYKKNIQILRDFQYVLPRIISDFYENHDQ